MVYLAALQNVDQEQVEAATIDGAGPVRRLFDVVLPAMREVIVINFMLTTILTFNYFDMIWVLTRGGPQNATHIFPTKIYELGFGQFRFGEAAAYGVFSILVLALLIALYFVVQLAAGGGGAGMSARRRRTNRVWLTLVQRRCSRRLILLPFFWMVSVSLKPADRALRHPRAAVAGEPDAGELRHRLPPGVPHLLPELAHRLAVDGGDHRVAGAACRLHLHPRRRSRLILVPDDAGDRWRRCSRRAPSSSRSTR